MVNRGSIAGAKQALFKRGCCYIVTIRADLESRVGVFALSLLWIMGPRVRSFRIEKCNK